MYKLIALAVALIFSINLCIASEAEDIAKIKERLNKISTQEAPTSIKPTVVKGLYEVMYGAEVYYLSSDGRYLLQGTLVDLETNQDLTDAALNDVRFDLLKKLDESEMIVFSPNKPRHTLTVFTDIDCTYC